MTPVHDMTNLPPKRRTLRGGIDVSGTGIHSGAPSTLRIEPALSGAGILLSRPGQAQPIAADVKAAKAELSDRRTVLVGPGGERFEQIEHVMAALAAEGVSDALLIQSGIEVPFLGGGSREYQEAIRSVGTQELAEEWQPLVISAPVSFADGDARFSATPHDGFRLSVFVEFPGTIVGSAGYTMELTPDAFFEDVSKARTFALAGDIEKLKAAGLARGGNLSNAVIFDSDRYHNESLHYPNEVVRHKIIDLVGDLALLGRPLRGHFWAWRAGHRSHVRFAQFLATEIFSHP